MHLLSAETLVAFTSTSPTYVTESGGDSSASSTDAVSASPAADGARAVPPSQHQKGHLRSQDRTALGPAPGTPLKEPESNGGAIGAALGTPVSDKCCKALARREHEGECIDTALGS